jgi:hypothetical protein
MTVGDHDPADDPSGEWLLNRPVVYSRLKDPRVMARLATPYRVDFSYDIPYVCGIDDDDDVLYADISCPINAAPAELWAKGGTGPLSKAGKGSRDGGGTIDLTPFVWLHECGEKVFIELFDDVYLDAHGLITIAEHDAVVEAGINWKRYSNWFDRFDRRTERETIKRVPKKLFMVPYRHEGDWLLIGQMQAAMV